MAASSNGYLGVVQLLLKAGASANMREDYGETALTLAVYWGKAACVAALEEHLQAEAVRRPTAATMAGVVLVIVALLWRTASRAF